MLKICKVCHKYFQGEDDVCPKCSQKIEDIRRKEEKKQGITSRIKQLSKSKIIIFIASTFILMTIFSQLTAKSKYNDEAKEIYLFAKKHTYFSDGIVL